MQIEALLQRHGIPLLGVAHTAFAIERSGDAFKIGFDPADGWPAWAAWSAANPGPHVPCIRACHWIYDTAGRPVLFVGHVERLFPSLVGSRWMRAWPECKRDPVALAARVERTHPGVAAILRAAAGIFPRAHWDMGGANWLEREDGTLVLNDPLSRI